MCAPCEGMRRRGCSLPRAGLAPAHGDGSRASQGPRPWCPRAPGGLSAAWPNRGGLGSPSGPWLPPVWEGGSAQGPAVWLACLCQPSECVPSATLTPEEGGHEAQSLPRAPWGSGPTTGQGCRVGVHSLWTGGGAPHHRGPAPRLWAPLSPLRPRHCHRSGTGDHSRGRSETNTCSRWTAQQRGSGVSGPGFAPCVRVARRPVCPKPKPHLQMGPSMCSTGRAWENQMSMISNNDNDQPPGESARCPRKDDSFSLFSHKCRRVTHSGSRTCAFAANLQLPRISCGSPLGT